MDSIEANGELLEKKFSLSLSRYIYNLDDSVDTTMQIPKYKLDDATLAH